MGYRRRHDHHLRPIDPKLQQQHTLKMLGRRRPTRSPARITVAFTHLVSFMYQPLMVLASSPPYNAYSYDLTTPQFTPDGRLLQVEYASRAPERSGPLVAVPVLPSSSSSSSSSDNDKDDVPSAVIVSLTQSQQSAHSAGVGEGKAGEEKDEEEKDDDGDNDNEASKRTSQIAKTTRRRGQSRLISLPLGPSSSSSSPSITIGLSGILADATSLLRTVRDDLTAYRRTYGLGKLHAVLPIQSSGGVTSTSTATAASAQAAPTVVARRLARAVADKCQSHSFGGGIRPYGASVLICGVDESGVCICVTEPSGAVLLKLFNVGGVRADSSSAVSANIDEDERKDKVHGDNVVVVGGNFTLQRKLKEQVAAKLLSSDESSSTISRLRHSIDAVVQTLLETHGYLGKSSESQQQDNYRTRDVSLEVVIACSDGSYRLSDKQVDTIIERLQSAQS